MKKMINRAPDFVDEMLEGILFAYGCSLKQLDGDKRIILRNSVTKSGKVGIVTGGGSGHLPVFLGYVGEGMLDGCAVGNVFASPSSQRMLKMIRACDKGSGVLCLYGNYGGDNLNFEMACEQAELEDIETIQIRVSDDVASGPKDEMDKRRGVAGMVYAFKVAGAAAEKLMSLEQVADLTKRALSNIRTMGIALTPCIVPEAGKPTFNINDDEIEVGMGIHGEPGIQTRKMMSADEVAEEVTNKILEDMPISQGAEVSIMINGLGATPMEELLIIYRKVHQILEKRGISIFMPHIGEFATSMEMAGLSITIFKLDPELKSLLRDDSKTPFYTSYNK